MVPSHTILSLGFMLSRFLLTTILYPGALCSQGSSSQLLTTLYPGALCSQGSKYTTTITNQPNCQADCQPHQLQGPTSKRIFRFVDMLKEAFNNWYASLGCSECLQWCTNHVPANPGVLSSHGAKVVRCPAMVAFLPRWNIVRHCGGPQDR